MLNHIVCLDDIQRIVNLSAPLVIKTMEQISLEYANEDILPHRHNFYTIIFVQQAQGHHLIDFTDYAIQPNTIYFISSEQIHHLKLAPNPQGYVIMFNDDFLVQSGLYIEFIHQLGFFYQITYTEPLQISEDITKLLHQLVKALHRETLKLDEFTHEIAGTLLKVFLLACRRIYKQQDETIMKTLPTNRAFNIVKEFKTLVNLHFATKHKVSDYAEMMNFTASYLNQTIKQETGVTPKDFIIQRIMVEAKKKALFTDMSAKEIANSLGFDDPAHFSKLFKNTESINFSNFRDVYLSNL
jgi:AraC-like DNA-binding protein